jgi:diketogulonate reductase-like aldo/keto reductase
MMRMTLNNGVQMPALGLGVFQSPPDQTAAAVELALAEGYRLIDTAAAYANERQVGEGIRRAGIPRDDVFIETKVWISDYGYEATLHAFDKSAGKLGVDRLDLVLLHQPLPSRFDLTLDAYHALEKLLADGRVRAIGVSNFMPEHLQRLLANASVVPVGRASCQPDRGASVLPADRVAASAQRARHPDASLVSDWRHHSLRWQREAHLR